MCVDAVGRPHQMPGDSQALKVSPTPSWTHTGTNAQRPPAVGLVGRPEVGEAWRWSCPLCPLWPFPQHQSNVPEAHGVDGQAPGVSTPFPPKGKLAKGGLVAFPLPRAGPHTLRAGSPRRGWLQGRQWRADLRMCSARPLPFPAPHFPSPPPAFVPWSNCPLTPAEGIGVSPGKNPRCWLGPLPPDPARGGSWGPGELGLRCQGEGQGLASSSNPSTSHPTSTPGGPGQLLEECGGRGRGTGHPLGRTQDAQSSPVQRSGGSQPRARPQGKGSLGPGAPQFQPRPAVSLASLGHLQWGLEAGVEWPPPPPGGSIPKGSHVYGRGQQAWVCPQLCKSWGHHL